MKAATDIVSLYQVLTPAKFLTLEEQEFYVDVYGLQIKRMRTILQLIEDEKHTIYVSGLSGSGKTTALNFLPDTDLHEKFEVKFLMGRELFELEDLDIIDVLLMLCFDLVEDNDTLKELYLEKLIRIENQAKGRYEEYAVKEKKHNLELGVNAEVKKESNILIEWLTSFGGKLSFFGDYRYNRSKRTMTREIFRPHVEDILKMTNAIIGQYMDKKDSTGKKKLLLIFHELNHIKNLEIINKLLACFIRLQTYFTLFIFLLTDLSCLNTKVSIY